MDPLTYMELNKLGMLFAFENRDSEKREIYPNLELLFISLSRSVEPKGKKTTLIFHNSFTF